MTLTIGNLRRIAIVVGWLTLLAIVGSTLSPGDARPHIPKLGANAERFVAYLAAGALLTFAYPRKRWLVLSALVALAAGLEWLQTLEATRHGLPRDALVKILGALFGSTLAIAAEHVAQRYFDTGRPPHAPAAPSPADAPQSSQPQRS
ncbi:VanZ family protein [Hyphomicrobiales bacterium]|nr:VanZ family protein [Hyphomicrobiales bacterium]CAH1701092.1 VanZ family protein [Hyphomicrobiales bacterium]CAI0344152.1 VanZ family protein [Hyphomicrobiales bacterium]